MKKLVALTLALCLLGGSAALAENTFTHNGPVSGEGRTEVTYTVEPNTAFTVTIPGSVAIDPVTFEGSLAFAISAPTYNVRGDAVTIELAPGERSLRNGDIAIPYVLKDVQQDYTFEPNEELRVLGWHCDGKTTEASGTLTVTAEKREDLPAGLYTDQLTFEYTGEADVQTNVELVLEESYTVTIPPTLAIPFEQEQTQLPVTVSELRLLAPVDGQKRALLVKSASAAGELTNANGDALPYTLAPGELVFRARESQSMLVSISPDAWSRAPGGDYTGTVTFSMECVYRAQ